MASVFPFESARSWMNFFYDLPGRPIWSIRKASRDHLPLRRDRRRTLHVAGLRGGASPASGEVADLYHSASLARGRCDVSVRGFGLLKSVVGTPVYISNERQFFPPGREDL